MEKYIDTNIFLAYSPDEAIWFLERRDPDNWAISQQEFNTDLEAIEAYNKGSIIWEAA